MVTDSRSDSIDGYWEVDSELFNSTKIELVAPLLPPENWESASPSYYIFLNSGETFTVKTFKTVKC
jgi:hypothetical protein